MRIIGGFFKGRKIFDAVDKSTRPLKDMVRESIFNILDHSKNEGINFKKSKILDLFSGTGSFGLECVSRGASKVIFFENYKKSYKILIKNINKLNCINETEVYEKNAYVVLSSFHTLHSRDSSAIQPRRKERSSAQCAAAGLSNAFSRRVRSPITLYHRHANALTEKKEL